jgi:hypothetical protein
MNCSQLGCARPAKTGGLCVEHQLTAAADLRAAMVSSSVPKRIVLVDDLVSSRTPQRMSDETTVSGRLQRAQKRRSPVA